jgi:hypothetical protein
MSLLHDPLPVQQELDPGGAAAAASRRRPRVLGWLAMLLIFGIGAIQAVPDSFFAARQTIDDRFDLLDDHWKLEFSARLARGEIAGRDFAFNYGPLYQLLEGGLGVLAGGDPASLLRYQRLLQVLVQILAVWSVIALLTNSCGWRSVLFALWVVVFPVRTLKPFGAIAAVVAIAAAQRSPRAWKLWLAALLPGLLVFYALDLGVFCFATLALTSLVNLLRSIVTREFRACIRSEGRVWMWVAVDTILLCLAARFGLHFPVSDYLAVSAEIARGYSTMMVWPLSVGAAWLLALGLAISLIGLAALLASRRFDPKAVDRAIPIAVFAILWLRYAVTRSDPSHVFWALLPCEFLILVALPALFLRARPRLALPLAAVWVAVFAADSYLMNRNRFAGLGRQLQRAASFRWQRPSLTVENETINDGLAAIERSGLRGRPLLVWPAETIVNVLSGSPNANPLLQTYVAHTEDLEHRIVASLEHEPEAHIVLFRGEPGIDSVPNLSRTPLVFRYLLDHYELQSDRADEVVILRRAARERGYGPEHELEFLRLHPLLTSWDNVLLAGEEDVRERDVLSLTLKVHVPLWARPLKPGLLNVLIWLEDGLGTQIPRRLLVPADGMPHSVLISASDLDNDYFLGHFTPQGPLHMGRRVKAITIRWDKLDMLSAEPDNIELLRATVLRPPWRSRGR